MSAFFSLLFWKSLSLAEKEDITGVAMVAIGLLGELFLVFASFWLPYNPTNFSPLDSILGCKKKHLEMFFVSLVAIGVGLELYALPKALDESHEKIALLENKTEELRAKVQDRKISTNEHVRIVECLREGPRGVVILGFDKISGATGQHEAKEYALQIASVFDEAGFIGSTNRVNLAAINTPGVVLFVMDIKHPPAEALSIQACFRANDILPSDIQSGYAPDTNSVIIWISTKP
jgi:hypothetical protein